MRRARRKLLIYLVVGAFVYVGFERWQDALAEELQAANNEDLEHLQPALPTIPDREFKLTDFGGAGDGATWNTDVFKQAIAKIDAAGGGRLVVPKGVYKTLPFALCSSLDLHLDDGAVIQAADKFADFGLPEPETLKSQDEVREKVKAPAPLITGKNLHDVAITGSGVIDGAGATWWAWSERASRSQPGRLIYPRANLVVIDGCQRLHIDGITLRNSSKFHLVPNRVSDLVIERVKVQSPEPRRIPTRSTLEIAAMY